MAKNNAVWGIDIGQCALKALRCMPHEKEENRIVVDSFDYIEYPKILSQPEAEPEELIKEALEQFLSRNDLTNDYVAMSVAGQSGLARFIKLPPVESKKIPDIVKYEARQQIPFALEDVVWDYQQLKGGSEEDGFALEPEVGLFAMKRDQVARSLQPLEDAGIEVDYIQLMPLAVYNYLCFDMLEDVLAENYDPENPPDSTVIISLGTDTTDLVVTNGFRVWQRNIPIGGSHFTRALSREMKLTFVKAEHLKRNAMEADDPKAVFQAMRPVFSDLLAEIQRSLGYFASIDKTANISKVVALGNAMKLPGLQRYLSQNLEHEVVPIEEFKQLSLGSVQAKNQFKDNLLSFAISYGLCIQGLGKSQISTNLLPEEIVRSRLIRSKKPWAVAGVAALMLGLTFNYMNHVSAWQVSATEQMKRAETKANAVKSEASKYESENQSVLQTFDDVQQTRKNLMSNVEGRYRWLELLKAIEAAVPKDVRPKEERKETAEDISNRNELHIVSVDMQEYDDVESEYFTGIESKYRTARGLTDELAEEGEGAAAAVDVGAGTSGGIGLKDMVIQLTGYHYHNLGDQESEGAQFVNSTLIKQLEDGLVELPDGPEGSLVKVPISDLGISRPWVVKGSKIMTETLDPDSALAGASSRGGAYGGEGYGEGRGQRNSSRVDGEESKEIKLRKYNFIVQFIWKPTNREMRRSISEQRKLQEERAAAEAELAQDETEI